MSSTKEPYDINYIYSSYPNEYPRFINARVHALY